jgi:hypothetical protein
MNKKVILLTKLSMAITFCYGAYLLKTAAGINLSSNYSAPRFFKLPLLAIHYPIGGHQTNLKNKIKWLHNYLHNR